MENVFNSTGHKVLIPDIQNSKGEHLFDKSGKKYIDLEGGIWCLALGHNHNNVNDAILNQITKLTHSGFCFNSQIVQQAAELILSKTNFENGKCAFLSSGTEAMEFSRQISKFISPDKISMTLTDSYLGISEEFRYRANNWFQFNWSECKSCSSENCNDDCPLIKQIPEEVSEFIFEPGSSSGNVNFPPEKLITKIVEKVRSNGGLIIVDEVTTGLGRTGKWFGFEHYDVKPDIIALGKCLGNGYPVSCVILCEELSEHLQKNNFRFNQSHFNDPLGAAVAEAVIKTLEDENLINISYEKGKYFLDELKKLVDDKIIVDVRGRGMMLAIEFCDNETAKKISDRLFENGFIICCRGNIFRLDPPLITGKLVLKNFTEELKKIISNS